MRSEMSCGSTSTVRARTIGLQASVKQKARWRSMGWLETEGSPKPVCVKQGDLHGMESRAGVRASIVALKRRNGRGAKGRRKVDVTRP